MHNGNINDFLQANPGYNRYRAVRLLSTNIHKPHLSQITEIVDAITYLHSYDPPIVHADIRGVNTSNRKR